MKISPCVAASVAVFIALCVSDPVLAQQAGDTAEESMNLFESVGKKQTAKDFKPAPDKMETNFGTLEFEGGSFPTEASTQKDLRRDGSAACHPGLYGFLSVALALQHRQIADSRLRVQVRFGRRRHGRFHDTDGELPDRQQHHGLRLCLHRLESGRPYRRGNPAGNVWQCQRRRFQIPHRLRTHRTGQRPRAASTSSCLQVSKAKLRKAILCSAHRATGSGR